MSFATPFPDMANRRSKRMVLRGSKRRPGRPSHSREDRIRTITWFVATATGLREMKPGAVGRRMQEEADKRGLEANHSTSKRWNHYAKGDESPSEETRAFVEEVVPGTSEVFRHGPGGLWVALWGNLRMQLCADEVAALFCAQPSDIDIHWLGKAIMAWRNHAALANSGALNEFPDGLYEAVIFGLQNTSVMNELKGWGVWNLIREEISDSEKSNIRRNPHKWQEIFAVGCDFSRDPVGDYLMDPIAFSQAAANFYPASANLSGRSTHQ